MIIPPNGAMTAAIEKRQGKKPAGVGDALKEALKQMNARQTMQNVPGAPPAPTVQHRSSTGQMGAAVQMPGDDQTIGARTGEFVIPAERTQQLDHAGILDDVAGQSPQHMAQAAIERMFGTALHYATGGIVIPPPTTNTDPAVPTAPPKQGGTPAGLDPLTGLPYITPTPTTPTLTDRFSGGQIAIQQPLITATAPAPPTVGLPPAPTLPPFLPPPGGVVEPPVFTPIPPADVPLPPGVLPPTLPTPPTVGPIDIAPLPDTPDLGVGEMPTLSPEEIRSLYDSLSGLYISPQELDNIAELERSLLNANLDRLQRAAEEQLGAAAASLGAIGGSGAGVSGDVLGLAGRIQGQRIQAQAEGETAISINNMKAKREEAQHLFDEVMGFAKNREGLQFGFAENERKIAADIALTVYETTARVNTAQAQLDAAIASGNADRIAAAQADLLQAQTAYNNLQTQHAEWLSDHNLRIEDMNRLGQQWLATFNLEQLESGRDYALDVARYIQANDQFVSTQNFTARENDLDRKWRTGERLSNEEWQELQAARQREWQTGEAVLDRTQEAELQRLRIAGAADLARLSDQLGQPGFLTTAAGVAAALNALGVGWDDIKNLVGDGWDLLTGGDSPALVDDGTGNFVPADEAAGTGNPWYENTGVRVAAGAAGAALLIDAWSNGTSGDYAQGAAGGALTGLAIAGPWGAAVGAVIGGLSEAFGPSQRRVAQSEFTTKFDEMYRALESGGALTGDLTSEKSLAQPQNRMALAQAFGQIWAEYAKPGVGNIEISPPDLQRMARLGLAVDLGAPMGGTYIIDDPRIAALFPGGDVMQYLEFRPLNIAGGGGATFDRTGGSMRQMIDTGAIQVIDRRTGQPINMQDPAALKAIAAANLGGTANA